MCPLLPSETGQIKWVLGIICFPKLWGNFSCFLFFLLFLRCGYGRPVELYAAGRQSGLLFSTAQKRQTTSIKLHLGVKHFCDSSANALALRVLLVMVGDSL